MEWYELYSFEKELATLKAFIASLIAKQRDIDYFGLARVLRTTDYQEIPPILETFSERIRKALRVARVIGEIELADGIKGLLEESHLEDRLARINLQLNLAANAPSVTSSSRLFKRLLGWLVEFESGKLSRGLISIDGTYIPLSRLLSLVKTLQEVWRGREAADDTVFVPGRINISIVLGHVDAALNIIHTSSISGPQRERIENYLVEVKRELAKDTPVWRNIVGALAISAAVISGIADLPGALTNIRAAMEHILGVSIERHLALPPNPAPPPIKIDDPDVF